MEKIEDRPITLVEGSVRAVELESGTVGVEPETHHVLDPEWARHLLVEVESLKLATRQEVGEFARAVHRLQRVLVHVADLGSPECARDLAARFAHVQGRRPADRRVVVGDDVAGHEPL